MSVSQYTVTSSEPVRGYRDIVTGEVIASNSSGGDHNHDADYAPADHTHDADDGVVPDHDHDHNHDDVYAAANHMHDDGVVPDHDHDHNHDTAYAAANHTHDGGADEDHKHDGDYVEAPTHIGDQEIQGNFSVSVRGDSGGFVTSKTLVTDYAQILGDDDEPAISIEQISDFPTLPDITSDKNIHIAPKQSHAMIRMGFGIHNPKIVTSPGSNWTGNVTIGNYAGNGFIGPGRVNIGHYAGAGANRIADQLEGSHQVNIGRNAGYRCAGQNTICIGFNAGVGDEDNADVASQSLRNSIIINATGVEGPFETADNACYIRPIRNFAGDFNVNTDFILLHNTLDNEVRRVSFATLPQPDHDHDLEYVKTTGDRMTGALTLDLGNPGNALDNEQTALFIEHDEDVFITMSTSASSYTGIKFPFTNIEDWGAMYFKWNEGFKFRTSNPNTGDSVDPLTLSTEGIKMIFPAIDGDFDSDTYHIVLKHTTTNELSTISYDNLTSGSGSGGRTFQTITLTNGDSADLPDNADITVPKNLRIATGSSTSLIRIGNNIYNPLDPNAGSGWTGTVQIGNGAGNGTYGAGRVMIGHHAGLADNRQSAQIEAPGAIAIGRDAGKYLTGPNTVFIGHNAGCGISPPFSRSLSNTISISATGTVGSEGHDNACYINPIRELDDANLNLSDRHYVMIHDKQTAEVNRVLFSQLDYFSAATVTANAAVASASSAHDLIAALVSRITALEQEHETMNLLISQVNSLQQRLDALTGTPTVTATSNYY